MSRIGDWDTFRYGIEIADAGILPHLAGLILKFRIVISFFAEWESDAILKVSQDSESIPTFSRICPSAYVCILLGSKEVRYVINFLFG